MIFSLLLLFGNCSAQQKAAVSNEMVGVADSILLVLQPQQLKKAQLNFNNPDRLNWSNEPTSMHPRKGLQWGDMNDRQRKLVMRLLRTGLSEQGYQKAVNVMWLDEYLKQLGREKGTGDSAIYGNEKYWLSIFGKPSVSNRWGWRFEGHHLSLNFTVGAEGISYTPLFIGSNPAIVPSGPYAGRTNQAAETRYAWQLMNSLDQQQRQQAVLSDQIPKKEDILARTGNEDFIIHPKGLSVKNFTSKQQQLFVLLLKAYIKDIRPELSAALINRLQRQLSEMIFAWRGGTTKGAVMYYRIQAPDMVIEYCDRLKDINHIHTLWREPKEDFGMH